MSKRVFSPNRVIVSPLEFTNDQILRAARTVIVYSISDIWDLEEYETMWVSYHTEKALSQFAGLHSHSMSASVKYELLSGEYSRRLNTEPRPGFTGAHRANKKVRQASVQEWAQMLSDVVTQCYDVRPMIIAALHGQLSGILVELGVGNVSDPRASLYLPSAIRWIMNTV